MNSPTLALVSDDWGVMQDRIEQTQTGSQAAGDPVVEVYKRDVDRSLLRENLRLSPTERVAKLAALLEEREAGTKPGSTDKR